MKAENENKKGLWTEEEDRILLEYIREHGRGKWNRISKMTGLKRCGKSCRLRWLNYLSPNVKHGDFSEEEEDLIIRLHNLLGNRWSLIAGRVPGRTDNQVKNHWNSHLSKRLGIKKQNRKAVCFTKRRSSQTHETQRQLVDNENIEVHPNSEITINVGDTSNGEAQLMDQHYVESLLFSNDLFNLTSPGLVDFLDSYPLDQISQYY